MKKSVVVIGGILALAAVSGGLYYHFSSSRVNVAAYWDGKVLLNQAGEDGSLPLLRAVRAKDSAAAAYLMGKGADVDAADKTGDTAVLAALETGDTALFATLAAASRANWKEAKYMEKAVASGQAAMVRALLEKGGDANAILAFTGRKRPDDVLTYSDPRVMTPLKKAVAAQDAAMTAVLLEYGAEGAEYFLGEELRRTTPEMVKALVKGVSNLRQMAVKGMDLLTYAAGEADPEIVKFLLQENIGDVNKALQRMITYRKADARYQETIDIFLQAGAAPTADILEQLLKKKQTDVFAKTAACFAHPNVRLSQSGERLLVYAIRMGDDKTVAFLLQHGADIWEEDKDGLTPLKLTLDLGDARTDMLRMFMETIKDVNETGYQGETLLMLFAGNGNQPLFEETVGRGGDIWQKDNDGKTVLMYAAAGGNTKILNYLLQKGDNPNTADKKGQTPLMYAAAAGKAPAVKFLADKGADISAMDEAGRTALMYAAENGYVEVVNMLINMGESAAAEDKQERSVLMYAAKGSNEGAVDMLLMKGVDVNHLDNHRRSALSYAVIGGNPAIVEKFLKQGANSLMADMDGYVPAMFALQQGNEKLYRQVAWQNQFEAVSTDNGKNMLIYAVEGGNLNLISSILRERRDLINKKDNEGRTALMLLAGSGRPETVREALGFQGDISAVDNNGKSVLMYAAENSVGVTLISILKAVLKNDINKQDSSGRSPLMYAVGYQNNQPVKMHMLLTNGADAEAADKDGKTVLMYAVGNTHNRVDANVAAELAEKVKNIDVADKAGRTALMYAAANPEADGSVMAVLLGKGAKASAADNSGKTVLMYAAESGDISKLRLLLARGADKNATAADGKKAKDFINQEQLCFKQAAEALLK